MKQGWEIKKIKDICNKASSNIAQNKIVELDGDYPVFGASGFVQNIDFYHRDKRYIGVVKDGSGVGRVNIYPPYSSLLGTLQYILPNDGYDLDFVAYALKRVNLPKFSSGAAIPHIYFRDYGEVEIAVPSLDEQKRIVEILDKEFEKIDTLKANAEKGLQHAKDLYDKILIDKFSYKKGWIKSTLQEECYRITDGTHQTPQYYDSGYIFLSSGNVTNRKINWDNIKYIDETQHQEMQKRVSPQINDILLAKNGTTGVAAIVDKNVEFDIYVSLALLRTLGRVTPKYMLYFVNSPLAKEQFNRRLKGIGVPNLHLTEIRQVEISFPFEQKEQNEIVEIIELLDEKFRRFEAIAQQTIALCDDMKQALLRKAFNGEL